MSLRLEMLQAARLSRKQLGDSAPLVLNFISSRLHPDGGFCNRAGDNDLYYTVFGLESMVALGAKPPIDSLVSYLGSFGDGESLDLVHLASLSRAWASLLSGWNDALRCETLARRIERHRSADGGYSAVPGAPAGSVYACFLALGAYQDLRLPVPEPDGLLRCIDSLRAADGGYANLPGVALGLTPSTAAAVTAMRQLGRAAPPEIGEWLRSRCRPEGGFFASPQAPVPDLLSTATALHALAGLHTPIETLGEPCLDFIDSLWTNRGGFYGSWADDAADCEYTYYALLALGHLSR